VACPPIRLGPVEQKRIPALEAVERHDKLMLLGKPGAGKTTFLKWLALQCNEGKFNQNRVPFFVTLKEFAETEGLPTLLSFIAKQLTECGLENVMELGSKILQAGRAIVLLDGLDEVKAQDQDRIIRTICHATQNFDGNQYVITCRIAAKEYIFETFTEVEVADFDDKQIADFAHQWFQRKDPIKIEEFSKELQAFPGLYELATNPLLLTLLCLVFEEGGRFPANRSELYKEGLDVLLKKWDAKRNIKREEVYKQLSLQRKEDLLSQIAYEAFEQDDYFFKQRFVEEQIQNYIRNLPNARTDLKALYFDSEAVLNSIVAQHGLLVERARGIYSFSHLTFQEYFTARWFKENADGDFGDLVIHIINKQWREVFLLTVGMLKNSNQLLKNMKHEIDNIFAHDPKLQEFLLWINEKSFSVAIPYKPAAIRAFYFILALHPTIDSTIDRKLYSDIDYSFSLMLDKYKHSKYKPEFAFEAYSKDYFSFSNYFDCDGYFTCKNVFDNYVGQSEIEIDLYLNLALDTVFNLSRNRDTDLYRARARLGERERNEFLVLCFNRCKNPELRQVLQDMHSQISGAPQKNWEEFAQWWRVKGWNWAKQFRDVIVKYRNIGHEWNFDNNQIKLLRQYYEANKLLVDCLSSDCYVSREVREEIESTLLSPLA
jgi:GTPase SAR1 family protein